METMAPYAGGNNEDEEASFMTAHIVSMTLKAAMELGLIDALAAASSEGRAPTAGELVAQLPAANKAEVDRMLRFLAGHGVVRCATADGGAVARLPVALQQTRRGVAASPGAVRLPQGHVDALFQQISARSSSHACGAHDTRTSRPLPLLICTYHNCSSMRLGSSGSDVGKRNHNTAHPRGIDFGGGLELVAAAGPGEKILLTHPCTGLRRRQLNDGGFGMLRFVNEQRTKTGMRKWNQRTFVNLADCPCSQHMPLLSVLVVQRQPAPIPSMETREEMMESTEWKRGSSKMTEFFDSIKVHSNFL